MSIRYYSALLFTCVAVTNVYAAEPTQHRRPSLYELKELFNKQKQQSVQQKSLKSPSESKELLTGATVRQDATSTSVLLAAGSYENDQGLNYPMILRGENGGTNWSYVLDEKTIAFPKDFVEISQSPPDDDPSMSCDGQDCVLATHYQSSNKLKDYKTPLFLITHDGGLHWSYGRYDNPSNLKDNYYDYAHDVSCSHGICVAVGRGLKVSQNAGDDWTFVSKDNIKVLPGSDVDNFDYATASFENVSCDASRCIAVGEENNEKNKKNLVTAISEDKGANWTVTSYAAQPSEYDTWNLYSASCYEQSCVAAGSMRKVDVNSGGTNYEPFILSSQDSGAHWKYIDLSTLHHDGFFINAHCDADSCMVKGYEDKDGKPFVGVSKDFGVNWEFSTGTELFPFTYQDDNSFNEYFTHCLGTTCISLGEHPLNDGNIAPSLAVSSDKGLSWQFPYISDKSNLPTGFKSGWLSLSAFIEEPNY